MAVPLPVLEEPESVSVKLEDDPAGTVEGLGGLALEVNVRRGGVTLKASGFVVLDELETLTEARPFEAVRLAGMLTAMHVGGPAQPTGGVPSCLSDVAEPPCGVQLTVEPDVNPVPVSVMVKVPAPAYADAGESEAKLNAGWSPSE